MHILQSLNDLTIADSYVSDIEQFLMTTLAADNKFVRSWAHTGFYLLACAYAQYSAQVDQLFQRGMGHEPASVRARIRNIRKLS